MKKINENFQWETFVVKDLEKKHNLTAQAKTDGLTNEPSTNAEGFSVVENELKNECDTYLEKHTNNLRDFLKDVEENQNQLSGYLKQNHFEPIFSKLDADFHTISNEKKIKLTDYKNSYDTYLEEKNAFKRFHQLSREPNSATITKTVVAFCVVGFLLIVELFANTFMLSPAMVGGAAEGLSIAGSVAFLNVFISSLVGYYVVKNFNHIEKPKKILFTLLGSLYFLIITYINTALGAYRSQAEEVFNKQISGTSELTTEQMTLILRNSVTPWNVEFSFLGIVLTFIGISFAFIAIIDGLNYNDSYPGYGPVGQKVNEYKNFIKKTFHEYANEVSSLFSHYNKELQHQLSTLLNSDLNNWDSNANLIQKEFVTYKSKVEDLEEKTQHMIGEYRNENKRVRKTNPPKYFDNPFLIKADRKNPEVVFPDVAFHYMTDAEREKTKIEYSNEIDKKFKECEISVEELQKLSEDTQKELHEKFNT